MKIIYLIIESQYKRAYAFLIYADLGHFSLAGPFGRIRRCGPDFERAWPQCETRCAAWWWRHSRSQGSTTARTPGLAPPCSRLIALALPKII